MEDDFRMGMSFSAKGTLKLFSHFDKADIIIASPLGLRLIVGIEADSIRFFVFFIVDCVLLIGNIIF